MGWMATLPTKQSYEYEFDYGSQFVNISYTGKFYFLDAEDYVSVYIVDISSSLW